MLIKSIHVKRLFGEYDYGLELTDCLTFLHSPNGYGKSTLMHMLYSALKGDAQYLASTPFSRMDVCFEGSECLSIRKDAEELEFMLTESGNERRISAAEMSGIRGVTYIPPERLMVQNPDGTLSPALASFAAELTARIRAAAEDSALVLDPEKSVPPSTDEELELEAKNLKARLDYIARAGITPRIPSGMEFPPSRYELSSRREEYGQLIRSVRDYTDRNYELAESLNVFLDIVNQVFINKTVSLDGDACLTVTMRNGSELKLQNLSSGERQILIMFYTLLFRTEPGSVVILDEPEISLHVSWQQKLGDFFLDICRIRGMQMIVATHSPTVIHDKWDDARELKAEDARIPDIRRHLQRDVDEQNGLRRPHNGR